MTTVINLFGGPGSGKSTTAAGLFYEMKRRDYSVELVTEYAKELVYEKDWVTLKDQERVFANQLRRQNRLRGAVDWIVTDSPLLLSLIYGKNNSPFFAQYVVDCFNSFDNYNIFLQRTKPYRTLGRTQTEHGADVVAALILNTFGNRFHRVLKSDDTTVGVILESLAS